MAKKATKKATKTKTAAKKKPAAKAKKTATKKAAPKRKATASAVAKAMTKSQVYAEIAESCGLSKREVQGVFEELGVVIERHIKKRAVGHFTLPGLLKIQTKKKPARPAKKGVPNPFKPGELMDVPARPASTTVRCRPLKRLKDMAC